MVFFVNRFLRRACAHLLFVVDRKDLDYQTMKEYDRFEKGSANSNTFTAVLKRQLEDSDSRIIITTIQKLSTFVSKNKGHEICLILDKTYLWNTAIEGEILQIHVNQNGYVAVVSTDVTNKSIITCYNSEGKKLFASYFATTTIIDVSISNDNKNIVIGEVDTSGTIIKSSIKVLSIENAQKDTENTISYTYDLEDNSLITNVQYHDKNQISCVYDNGIGLISNNIYKQIVKVDNDNITYAANNFKNDVIYIEEESSGMFKSISNIHIVNVSDNHDNIYKLENIAKEVYVIDNKMAINSGSEIYFINTSGWLVKKYVASQEITNVKMSSSLAAIIYKDKIVIVEI